MAHHTNLPLYRDGYDFLLFSFRFTKKLEREYKYTVGEKIKKFSLDLLLEIVRANRSQEMRKKHILSALEYLETLQVLMRILRDVGQIGTDTSVGGAEKINTMQKQLSGWYGSISSQK
ncbi:MAG: four helix bundle protein [Candidatus Moranbacteria bacterium]|nr:four helix bundle protein [Candidatus Moranbacteria bacterium]